MNLTSVSAPPFVTEYTRYCWYEMYVNYVYMFSVHRDIKPSNLLVVQNKSGTFDVKVSDFGIAKECAPTSKRYMTTGIGTEYYRAPELLRSFAHARAPRDQELPGSSKTPVDVSRYIQYLLRMVWTEHVQANSGFQTRTVSQVMRRSAKCLRLDHFVSSGIYNNDIVSTSSTIIYANI